MAHRDADAGVAPATGPPAAVEPLTPGEPLTPDRAREHVEALALTDCGVGAVGLELEAHLVDLAAPADRVPYRSVRAVIDELPALPGGSAITMEPGGQLELSSPPAADIGTATDALREDQRLLAAALAGHGWGLAVVGCDPARSAVVVNPAARYTAMVAHFASEGSGDYGLAMMCSSASLQLNLNAGPQIGWADRLRLAYRLGPVLVAISACSPWLAGRPTGWRSTRQRIWTDLNPLRCGHPRDTGRPAADWAEFALAAPVMLVRGVDGHAQFTPVTEAVPFARWAAGEPALGGRLPTVDDLDYHLTTLFPPVRLRGFLELRYLDAVPAAYWPGLAMLTATLLDDPAAADQAAEAVESVAHAWVTAARDGLADPALRSAAQRCIEIAWQRVPAGGRSEVESLAELTTAGRSPGDDVAARAERDGPLAALVEYATELAR